MIRLGAPAFIALIIAACSKDPTQIVVVVDSDLEVPAELASVRAIVKSETEVVASERAFPLAVSSPAAGEVSLPFSFGLAPGSDREASLILEAQAIARDGSVVVIRRAKTRFIEHQTLLLPMFLPRACANVTCGEGETCTETGCAPEEIDPRTLPVIEPGRELGVPRKDAGEDEDEDASTGDDATADAGGLCAPPARDGDSCAVNSRCTGGTCGCVDPFADCDQELGCEADLTSDSLHCDDCLTMCPAGTSCIDRSCSACMNALDCPVDALPCTDVPVCQNGECSQPLFPGFCLIGGACYDDAEPHPTDPCLICDAANPLAWSASAGKSCNDSLFCTAIDTCDAQGSCVGSGTPCPEDALDCTTIGCNETLATCERTIDPSRCLIGGACAGAGEIGPGPCYVCNPSADQDDWSPNNGAVCDDGLFCTTTDRCDGSFNCFGSGDPCSVTTACTAQSCDEGNDGCIDFVTTGCFVNSTCYQEGETDPNNVCRSCQSGNTPWDFTPVPDDLLICGGNQICCGGVCTPVLSGACGSCGTVCPPGNPCICDGTGDPFTCCCSGFMCN